ncbi:hypothetical protein EV182_002389 [Spiromyces aspiralis]|uniref:Uncharacterized protein n=1 Tax=Spiromyces aspiralis TaxID=68401 RepID=A0ACC1HID5_9FUNG|nr:hypothetical protein EV182_002389 [Spiromyces aspiralis]
MPPASTSTSQPSSLWLSPFPTTAAARFQFHRPSLPILPTAAIAAATAMAGGPIPPIPGVTTSTDLNLQRVSVPIYKGAPVKSNGSAEDDDRGESNDDDNNSHDNEQEDCNSNSNCDSSYPRKQKIRFADDLYTPLWVRGTGEAKEGFCDACNPGKWLQLKNSAYWYHKQFHHGVSSVSGRPFVRPLQVRHLEPELIEGLCHQCRQWVPVANIKRKSGVLWFKHAHKCHVYHRPKVGRHGGVDVDVDVDVNVTTTTAAAAVDKYADSGNDTAIDWSS